jgi:hypothetical protein
MSARLTCGYVRNNLITSTVSALTNLPLPPVPSDLVQELISYMHDDTIPLDQDIKIRQGNFYIKERNNIWQEWVTENITSNFLRTGIQRITNGDLAPHKDKNRNFGLLYLVKAGGNCVTTRFYKPFPDVEPKTRSVFDFEQVEEVVRYQFKEGTWNLINNKFPHAVVGITEDRISLSVDFLSPVPPKFISDLMLSAA